jgi:hypothetical protein
MTRPNVPAIDRGQPPACRRPVTGPGLEQDHKQPAANQAYPGHIDLHLGLERRTEGAR